MTKATLYQIDAFTTELFGGNPAAVVLVEEWPSDEVMQKIARENNLSETAFLCRQNDEWHIRWFTPKVEVPLCGHATLASAFVLFSYIEKDAQEVAFHSKYSGLLKIKSNKGLLQMRFPKEPFEPVTPPHELLAALEATHVNCVKGIDYVVELESAAEVFAVDPDYRLLSTLNVRGITITAKGDDCDFVSRFFSPSFGIYEDPVTGSAHCLLAPYWSEKLGKKKLTAKQLSKRGGELQCEVTEDKVLISGSSVLYLKGEIYY